MSISVNGKTREVPEGATVALLLEMLGLSGMRVAVEVNRRLVPRAKYAEEKLREGDWVEIVTLVGGG
ncbi:MAG: sulfur carrier protein ThiS [Planctomycetota bacterium]|nr:sulfur carrier protein ThiS [Planctomycetota bacterium]